MKISFERALLCWLICSSCRDATAIVGRWRVGADAGAATARASDAGQSEGGSQPSSTRADSGAQADSGAPISSNTPALAPPPRSRAWAIESGSLPQFCAGRGGAIHSVADCVPIERQLFSYAVCACGDVRLQGDSFSIDSFDSSQGSYAPGEAGAPLGVNGSLYALANDIRLGGSVIVTGSDPLSIAAASFVVQGDLESQAPVAVSSRGVRVARDAWLAGGVSGPGPDTISIGRDAYLRPGVMGADALQGRVLTSDFALSPPCACDPSAQLDVPAIVAMAPAVADNDAAGVSRDVLSGIIDTTAIALPCGRFVLSELTIPAGTIAFTVSGRTALFIEGDVDIVGTVVFDLSQGAELDIFVAGDLKLQGTGGFGVSARPNALRIYVGGQVEALPTLALSAALYAPHASISTLTPDSYGALFVNSLATSGAQRLHYDRAILSAPSTCQSAGRVCTSCDECADGLACKEGRCGACRADSDCCAPLSCVAGRCSPLLLPQP